MQSSHWSPYLIYGLIISVYVPGVIALLRLPRLALMPIVSFSFLGMLLFTALGSWMIITRGNHFLGSLSSDTYLNMLIAQCLLFYVVVGPYVMLRKRTKIKTGAPGTDESVRAVLMMLTVGILIVYYLKVGKFLLFDLLAGHINRLNILDYRALTYGLKEYPLFRLGFLVFPALAAALSVGIASRRGRLNMVDVGCIVLCMIPPLLLAEKAAILHMAVIVFIAYTLHLGMQQRPLGSAVNPKIMLIGLITLVPTIAAYIAYLGSADGLQHLPRQILFRIFGVYSEGMAATVRYTDLHGFFNGATLPTFKGLFPHERIHLDVVMHTFLAAGTEVQGAAIPGATPVPANAEGYANFGWLGFVLFSAAAFGCIVMVQELLSRLRLGGLSMALMAWYGYLGFILSTTSVFGTFISLIHTVVAVGVILLWLGIEKIRLVTLKHV